MRTNRILSALFLALLGLTIGGCVVDASSQKKGPTPTVGQQLIDLKEAHNRGALTDEEYNSSKHKLLNALDCSR